MPGDGDTGANDLQNFPVLNRVSRFGSSTLVEGTVNSSPNTGLRIQFFSSAACDPLGFGEGQSLMGETTVTTDDMGNAAFAAALPTAVSSGSWITATATNPNGSTSEFSQCIEIS